MKRSPLKRKKPLKRKPFKVKPPKDKVLDDLWSEAIKLVHGRKCESCGSTRYLNSHHAFSRKNYGLRWAIDNGVCLCSAHHVFSRDFSAHQTPLEFADWLKAHRGESWYYRLKTLKNTVTCKDELDLFAIKAELEAIIKGEEKCTKSE